MPLTHIADAHFRSSPLDVEVAAVGEDGAGLAQYRTAPLNALRSGVGVLTQYYATAAATRMHDVKRLREQLSVAFYDIYVHPIPSLFRRQLRHLS